MKKKYLNKVKDLNIDIGVSVLFALKKMDNNRKKLLFVHENDKFCGLLSIGDIQRAILNGFDTNVPVSNILRDEFTYCYQEENFEDVKSKMLNFRTECMPILDSNSELIDVYFWEDVFLSKDIKPKANLNLPVVIMAGGKGTRMKPITNIIPKPLIPFGDRSMMEEIIQRFQDVGCHEFHASVNYKADMIKFYFDQIIDEKYTLEYLKEEKPLGTAGSLHLLNGKIDKTFFVSNCDILIEDDYEEIYKYHKKNENELTIVSALKNYPIPYGTLETSKNGILKAIREKPEFNFQINTGFYIVEPHLIDEVPKNEFFHITHLMEKILERNGRVGVYPVSEGSWKDIGIWEEYLKNNI